LSGTVKVNKFTRIFMIPLTLNEFAHFYFHLHTQWNVEKSERREIRTITA